jgi:hypothetical protein
MGKTNLVLLLPIPFRFAMSLRRFLEFRSFGAGSRFRAVPYLCLSMQLTRLGYLPISTTVNSGVWPNREWRAYLGKQQCLKYPVLRMERKRFPADKRRNIFYCSNCCLGLCNLPSPSLLSKDPQICLTAPDSPWRQMTFSAYRPRSPRACFSHGNSTLLLCLLHLNSLLHSNPPASPRGKKAREQSRPGGGTR